MTSFLTVPMIPYVMIPSSLPVTELRSPKSSSTRFDWQKDGVLTLCMLTYFIEQIKVSLSCLDVEFVPVVTVFEFDLPTLNPSSYHITVLFSLRLSSPYLMLMLQKGYEKPRRGLESLPALPP